MEHLRNHRVLKGIWVGFGAMLAVGVLVSLLVNYIVSREITWALYTAGAAALAFGIVTPLAFGGKHRLLISVAALAVLIMPFLTLVQRLSSDDAWVWPVGFPIAAVSVLAMFLAVVLFRYTKINRWYCASVIVLTALPINLIADRVVSLYENASKGPWQIVSDIASIAGICALAFYFMVLGRRQKKAKESA